MASAKATTKKGKKTAASKVARTTRGQKQARRAKGPTGLALAQQSSDFISRNYMRFVKKYPGEYVYALGNRVIAHGDDLRAVSDEAQDRSGSRESGLVLVCVPETIEDAGMVL